MPGKYWTTLTTIATATGSYITPALAKRHGVPPVELRKMASRGTLSPITRGIYQMPGIPLNDHNNLLLAYLWTHERGAISHTSALQIHGLYDTTNDEIHLTIDPGYRIRRNGGDHIQIHKTRLQPDEITRAGAITLTTIKRTLQDTAGTIPTDLFRHAAVTALNKGHISSREHSHLRHQTNTTRQDKTRGPSQPNKATPPTKQQNPQRPTKPKYPRHHESFSLQ